MASWGSIDSPRCSWMSPCSGMTPSFRSALCCEARRLDLASAPAQSTRADSTNVSYARLGKGRVPPKKMDFFSPRPPQRCVFRTLA